MPAEFKEGLMTGHRPFNEMTKGFSPERKVRVLARVSELKADMQRSQEDSARERNVDSDEPGGSS
jgi:hypothetical protein